MKHDSSESHSLSILIPALDEQAWIAHAVRTARASLRSSGVDGEVIVCDGGSQDATVDEARRFADRVLVCPPGRSAQFNAGAARARGDVLVMLHADALLTPRAVDAMVAAIDAGAAGGWFQIEILPDLQTGHSHLHLGWMAWGINLRTRLFRTATGDQCIFCRRDAFDAIGGMPDVALMEGNLCARSLRGHGSVEILGPELRISGRRWEKNGVLRTMLFMYGIRAAHRVGVSEDVLARAWRRWSK